MPLAAQLRRVIASHVDHIKYTLEAGGKCKLSTIHAAAVCCVRYGS